MKTAFVATGLLSALSGPATGESWIRITRKLQEGPVSVAASARLQVCGRAHIAVTCNPPDLSFELINMRSIRI